ncbi:hypothetical protein [Kitasatospora sp. NPDC004289]
MPHNLWIGRPGALREIDQAAKSWDRSADLGVTEFRALGGRATVVYTPKPVRRLKLSWEGLDRDTATYLDRLARRADGPGPLAVMDPASVNLLEPAQAAGRDRTGSTGRAWFVSGQPGAVVESTTVKGQFGFQAQAAESAVAWRSPYWAGGLPVVPGWTVSFRVPTAFPTDTCVAQLDFKSAAGTYLNSAVVTGRQVTAVVPPDAAFVTAVAKPGAVGTYSLANACYTIGGDWPDEALPGDGCPPMAITGYSDVPTAQLRYRNVSIDLLEVAGANG